MSKYTTLVRSICETESGLSESLGFGHVDDVIANSWNKIFTSNVSFFDESYKQVICSKILKHYYMMEIGAETVGLWKLWMNSRLEEIIPYYNQLYESQLIKFEPLWDVDMSRQGSGGDTRTGNYSGTVNGSVDRVDRSLYSDTPQGALTGVESEEYLTSATKDIGNESSTESRSNNENVTNTNEYVERITGKRGGVSNSKLLMEFRESFINVDMMVIEEFKDLFMSLW